MDIQSKYPDAFAQLGAIFRAWSTTTKEIAKNNVLNKETNTKEFFSHLNRLEDSETMAAFGYITRAVDRTGDNTIMQAHIVNTLAPDCEQERQKVRQDIKRRMDALEFFGLIERKYLTKTALQLSATEVGEKYCQFFNRHFAEENLNTKGGSTCLAA